MECYEEPGAEGGGSVGGDADRTSEEVFEGIIINSLRLLGMTDLQKIYEMTFWEYRLRMKAARLRDLDHEYFIAREAWQHREVTAVKQTGKKKKAVYTKFKSFFDYEAMEKEILEPKREKDTNVTVNRYAEFLRSKNNA